jgi:hypothetical protein
MKVISEISGFCALRKPRTDGRRRRLVCIAHVPQRDAIAAAVDDQGGVSIRFFESLSQFQGLQDSDWGPPRVRVSDVESEGGWYPDIVEMTGLSFSLDGDLLAIGSDLEEFGVSVFDFPTLRLRARHARHVGTTGHADRPVFHPNGTHLLMPGPSGGIAEVDALTGRETNTHKILEGACTGIDVDWSLGLVAACSSAGQVSVLHV